MALKDDLINFQKKKGMGIRLGDAESDCLTNERLADDVLLFATSLEQLQNMLCDSKRSIEKVGLNIHAAKTNILSNQSSNKKKEVKICNVKVEVLLVQDCAKYLGQTITFQQQDTTEIRSRIRAAWASFCRYKQELTSRSYPLQHRLRLFKMIISPTLGYACGTWTLTEERQRMIRSTQRKMLQLIVQTRKNTKKRQAT